MVSGSEKQIIFWDVSVPTSPVQLTTLSSPETSGNSLGLAIIPDKNILAVGGGSNLSFWDISNPAKPVQIGGYPSEPFGSVEMASDGNEQIFVSQAQHFIAKSHYSDLTKPATVLALPESSGLIITAAKFWLKSGDVFLAIGTEEGAVQLWELTRENHLIDLGSPKLIHSSSVISLEFSSDGRTLVSKGYDGTIIKWSLPEQSTDAWGSEYLQNMTEDYKNPVNFLEALKGASAYFKSTDMIFSHNGDYLISGNDDGSISIWDMTKPNDALSLLPNPLGYSALALENEQVLSMLELNIPNDKNAMVTQNSRDNTVKIWNISDLSNPKLISEPIPNTRSIFGYSKDNNTLILGEDHGVVFWNITNPLLPKRISSLSLPFGKNEYPADKVYISPNGNTLIFAGGQENTLDIWDVSDPLKADHVGSLQTQSHASALTLNPDTDMLAVADCDRGITLWNITNPKMPVLYGQPFLAHVEALGCIYQITFLGKDVLGISISTNGVLANVEIWNIADPGKPVLISDEIKDQLIMEFGFSPARNRIVTVNSFGQVIVWDVSSPSKPIILGYITGIIGWGASGTLEFNPDGGILVITYDNRPVLWSMDINKWKDLACEIAGRNFSQAEWQQYFQDEEYRITCPLWPAGE